MAHSTSLHCTVQYSTIPHFPSRIEQLFLSCIRTAPISAPVGGAFLGANDTKEVRVFESPLFGKIRVARTSDEPLFCLADICKSVELQNPSSVKARLDKDDVQLVDLHALNLAEGIVYGNSMATFVTESGFYDVILRSDSKKAKPFRKWVTSEVLPTIRKTGTYSLPNFNDPVEAARAWADAVEKNRNLSVENQKQQQILLENNETIKQKDAEINVYKPKAAYYDMIMANPSCSKVTSIAQDYGKSPQAFNDLLHELGAQYKVDKQWILYQKYKDAGYVHSKPLTITHNDGHKSIKYLTVWTQKGRLFLYDLLKENGILPMIERNANGEAH